MKLEENNIIVKRSYKTVYKCDDSIVKVFNEEHPKSDVFNEALITARIEETGLDIPKVKGVSLVEGLESMPKHNKVCHGDFNPSNVIVGKNGKMTVVDWAHATQGNASADAAMTYLLFALKDQETADLYLKLFCKKSDTARQYVQQWLPIVAAAQLTKDNELEKDFLMKWIDVIDYQ